MRRFGASLREAVGAIESPDYRQFSVSLLVTQMGANILQTAPGVGSLVGATGILSLGDMRYKGLYTVFGVLSYCVAAGRAGSVAVVRAVSAGGGRVGPIHSR